MSGFDVDPTKATSPDLNRRTFVGLSAAAATSGPVTRALIPENDPAIVTEHVTLRRPDTEIPAYAAWPADARPNVPSLVVVMHIWGVDISIRDAVRRFAKAGFAAIAPDLYARFDAPSGDGVTDIDVFRPYANRLERRQTDGDLRAAALWLTMKFPLTKCGITGFCMGGHVALLAAIDDPDLFSAVCPFYGSLKDITPDQIRVPICGNYGGRDTSIPAADVRTFRDGLHVPNDIRVYDSAGHAFFDSERASFVPSAAADAWKRTVKFLAKYLGQSP